jgi:hypothetical protein
MVSYDAQLDPEVLLQRIVYGRPAPLLKARARMDAPFFGRLFDELANNHAALVRVYESEAGARRFARDLRNELAGKEFSVGVKQDPDVPVDHEWFVVAYNNVTRSMQEPSWHHGLFPTQEWVDVTEAARILRVKRHQAVNLAKAYGAVSDTRVGGRNMMMIRRSALPEIANRPRQWKKNRRSW